RGCSGRSIPPCRPWVPGLAALARDTKASPAIVINNELTMELWHKGPFCGALARSAGADKQWITMKNKETAALMRFLRHGFHPMRLGQS
ncbi:MAG TPA: hypothetical protein VE200_13795, partial [Xanthobacteraceae bacterium]|nr:hypothetical protein [Xanthobacteraceae bacterium]